jgi:cytochrome-b5 reductase
MGALDMLATREGQIVVGATVGFLTIFAYSFKDSLVRWGLGLKPFQAVGTKFLNKSRQTVSVLQVQSLSHDTKMIRFQLPSHAPVLGLPVGKAIRVFCPNIAKGEETWNPMTTREGTYVPRDNGSGDKDLTADGQWKDEIARKYTPCSLDCDVGYFDLVVKVYGPCERFKNGGKVSQYLGSLKPGASLDIEGPMGLIEYYGRCEWKNYGLRKHVGMMAGGTGITPMLQIIKAVLMDDADTTTISVLFANQTEEDILVRSMLEQWAADYSHKFKVWYTVDRPPANWKYSSGFITAEMISQHMPPPGDDTLILMCGPPPMVKFACKDNLEKLGYNLKTMTGSF